jgi:glyoxylase-like metal-dependent hydrolase (beta-lactamase superfamily II)
MFRHLLHLFLLAGLLEAQPKLPNFDTVQIHTLPVQGNIYMLVGVGGNITLQAGKDGALLVDSMFAPLASKIAAEVTKLTNKPIQYIIDTHVHGDHVGGNAALSALGAPGAADRRIQHGHEGFLIQWRGGDNFSRTESPHRWRQYRTFPPV